MKHFKEFLKEVAITGNLHADLFSLIEMTNNLRSSIQDVAVKNPTIEQKLEELEKLAHKITISLKEIRSLV